MTLNTWPVCTGDRMVSELLASFAGLCLGIEVELNFTNAMVDLSQGEPWLVSGELVAVLDQWQTGLHSLHAKRRWVPRKIRLFKQVLAQWFAERPHYLL